MIASPALAARRMMALDGTIVFWTARKYMMYEDCILLLLVKMFPYAFRARCLRIHIEQAKVITVQKQTRSVYDSAFRRGTIVQFDEVSTSASPSPFPSDSRKGGSDLSSGPILNPLRDL